MEPMYPDKATKEIFLDPEYENFAETVRYIVKTLIPSWENLQSQDIDTKRLTGGMTNYLYAASTTKSSSITTVLVRMYGNQTELIIDRKMELENIDRCHKNGFGPRLFGAFKNGYVYEYFDGRPIPPEELHKCVWNAPLATEVARWHRQPLLKTETTSHVWHTIEGWLTLVPEAYTVENKQKNWKHIGGRSKVKEELEILKNMADQSQSPIVFSHNDLLGGNVIVNEKTGVIKFIDFEYASTNYQAFDIANHFNEWAGFEADYSRYPNKEQQVEFYTSYLTEWLGKTPSEQDVHKMYVQVNKFALVSHFYWGVWALVQGAISMIDFDFGILISILYLVYSHSSICSTTI